ncbi:MAG: exonuclease domain-containing protein [Salinivirgaceae bacterium]|jgi:DNA polymerase-3 subunit epsilon|nr:exonuclease domain-containing protein [Salinivirgaceae bacterium]
MYTIIDIETTGGNAKKEKITEVAIYKFDGAEVVDEFVTLINPEQSIPYYIQQLTGITNEMVKGAPKFYEVAKNIVEITENAVFVAHNAAFDYNFIQEEFRSLGYDFHRQVLCTVKLSRKIIPGHASYSLGHLSDALGISLQNRHRAAGDALATVHLFQHLLTQIKDADITDVALGDMLTGLNENLDKNTLKHLPESTGVYYFRNENGEIIYIGKSINIKKRVHDHFAHKKSMRSIQMKAAIAEIDCVNTGSELIALLHEAAEVKRFMPMYNKLLRRTIFNWGLYINNDEQGYMNLALQRNTPKNGTALVLYKNKKEAENHLFAQIEKYELCQKLCGVYKSTKACFHHQIGMCRGACIGAEDPDQYNKRVTQFLVNTTIPSNSFFIIDKGRNAGEKSIVHIENGIYKGFGYIETEEMNNLENLSHAIELHDDNKDVRTIIVSFLTRKRYEKVLQCGE